jgi:hypothetical protein
MRRFEIRLSEAAERALPGPLESSSSQGIIGKRARLVEQSRDSPEPVVAMTMRQGDYV